VEKKVPGAAVEYIVYDNLDRVALTQDGNLRAQNQWYFTKTDRLGRPVYSGIYTNATQTISAGVQALLNALDYSADPYCEKPEVNATYHGYSNDAFPSSGTELLTVNYYDDYDFDRDGNADVSYDDNELTGQETNLLSSTRFRATGSKIKYLEDTIWMTSAVFYDHKGRVIQSYSEHHEGGSDLTTVIYDWEGKRLKTKSVQTPGNLQGSGITKILEYDYDDGGRLTEITQTLDSEEPVIVGAYQYNELGQLTQKKLHEKADENFLQTVNLTYNIRGWLKQINDPGNLSASQLFCMELLRLRRRHIY
jgi:hypothetical protein